MSPDRGRDDFRADCAAVNTAAAQLAHGAKVRRCGARETPARPAPAPAPAPARANAARPHPAALALFSWADVPASASAFSSGVALFLAHAVLGYSLAGAAAHVAVLALLLSLLVALKNAAVTSVAPTPPPSILLHASTVHAAAAAAGKAAAAAVLRANELLAWSDPAASARALAYAWLAARLAFLLAPAALVTAWVAAFAAAPLYEAHGRAADALVAARLLPPYLLMTAVCVVTFALSRKLPADCDQPRGEGAGSGGAARAAAAAAAAEGA